MFICRICFNNFDFKEHLPRILGKCGHTICSNCIKNYIKALKEKFVNYKRFLLKCPFDQQEHLIKDTSTFKIFPKNFILIELIKKKNYKKLTLENNYNFSNLKKMDITYSIFKYNIFQDKNQELKKKKKRKIDAKILKKNLEQKVKNLENNIINKKISKKFLKNRIKGLTIESRSNRSSINSFVNINGWKSSSVPSNKPLLKIFNNKNEKNKNSSKSIYLFNKNDSFKNFDYNLENKQNKGYNFTFRNKSNIKSFMDMSLQNPVVFAKKNKTKSVLNLSVQNQKFHQRQFIIHKSPKQNQKSFIIEKSPKTSQKSCIIEKPLKSSLKSFIIQKSPKFSNKSFSVQNITNSFSNYQNKIPSQNSFISYQKPIINRRQNLIKDSSKVEKINKSIKSYQSFSNNNLIKKPINFSEKNYLKRKNMGFMNFSNQRIIPQVNKSIEKVLKINKNLEMNLSRSITKKMRNTRKGILKKKKFSKREIKPQNEYFQTTKSFLENFVMKRSVNVYKEKSIKKILNPLQINLKDKLHKNKKDFFFNYSKQKENKTNFIF